MTQATEEEAEIDLTPMLDVVFIMLIFFIVTVLVSARIRRRRHQAALGSAVVRADSKSIAIKILQQRRYRH